MVAFRNVTKAPQMLLIRLKIKKIIRRNTLKRLIIFNADLI